MFCRFSLFLDEIVPVKLSLGRKRNRLIHLHRVVTADLYIQPIILGIGGRSAVGLE